MICPACGANLADDLKFCTQCGTALEAAPVAEEAIAEEAVAEEACDACAFEPEAVQEPVFDAEIAPESLDFDPEAPVEPEKPADKKPMIFGIISLVLGIISLPITCCGYTSCFGFPLTIAAIVLGVVGFINSKKADNKTARILSIVGIALGAVAIVIFVVSFVIGLIGGFAYGFTSVLGSY